MPVLPLPSDDARNLACARIIVFAVIAWRFSTDTMVAFAELPPELIRMPIGMGWLRDAVPTDPEHVRWLAALVRASGAAAAAGLFTRVSTWVATLSACLLFVIPNMFGHVGHDRHHLIWFAAILFRLTVVSLPPTLSEDLTRYRWQGRLQAAGGNPYTEAPDNPTWASLRDSTWNEVNRKDLPSVYGPLLETTYAVWYRLVSAVTADEALQVWLFKIPFALCDLLAAGALIWLLNSLALPAAWVLRGNSRHLASAGNASAKPLTTREAIGQALADRSFQLLCIGFFVCGFHVAFIATHLPGVVASCQLPPAVGAWALSVIGLFNIVGSFAMGWAVGRWRMKSLLALVYATRALAVLVFMLAPKTEAVMLVFAAVIGLTYLSTVPPTDGLVAKMFGPANMGTLFGIVMVSHQVGGFLGAYMGGKAFEATGSYDWMWYADIVLAVGAALIHLPIREARLAPRPAVA